MQLSHETQISITLPQISTHTHALSSTSSFPKAPTSANPNSAEKRNFPSARLRGHSLISYATGASRAKCHDLSPLVPEDPQNCTHFVTGCVAERARACKLNNCPNSHALPRPPHLQERSSPEYIPRVGDFCADPGVSLPNRDLLIYFCSPDLLKSGLRFGTSRAPNR